MNISSECSIFMETSDSAVEQYNTLVLRETCIFTFSVNHPINLVYIMYET